MALTASDQHFLRLLSSLASKAEAAVSELSLCVLEEMPGRRPRTSHPSMVCSFSYDRVDMIFSLRGCGVAEVLVCLINTGSVWREKVPSKLVGDAHVLFPLDFSKVPSLVGLTWK